MTGTCPQCQAPILETQRFCRYCGYRLDEGLQDYVETTTFGQARSPVSHPDQYPSWSPPTTKQPTCLARRPRRSKIVHRLFSLALMVAIGAGVVFYRGASGWRVPSFLSQPVVGVYKSYIGVEFGDDGAGGALIDSIATEGGPADLAGLIGGDLIIEAQGQPIASNRDMSQILSSTPPRSPLQIKFLRDGRQMETVLVTGRRGDFSNERQRKPHGLFGIEPNALKRVYAPQKGVFGVRLDKVLVSSPADMAGVQQGDIVIEFGGHPIRTPRELIRRFHGTDPYSVVQVKVVRQGAELIIPVKMGRSN